MKNINNHKEVDLQRNVKVVISAIRRKFSGAVDVRTAMEVINKAAKDVFNLSSEVTGTGTLLGNVMILDLNIPLRDYTDWWDASRFNRRLATNLCDTFGQLNVGYVSPTPVTTKALTINLETDADEQDVRNALRQYGNVTIN